MASVTVPLSDKPPFDEAWIEGFEHPKGVRYTVAGSGPTIVNDTVHFSCSPDLVHEIMEGIDHRIAQANAGYKERLAELRRRGISGT